MGLSGPCPERGSRWPLRPPAAWSRHEAVLAELDGPARLRAALELSETVREVRLAGIRSRTRKADFIVHKERPFGREELKRRQRISLLGVELSVASLEDAVIAKPEWSRLGSQRCRGGMSSNSWTGHGHAWIGPIYGSGSLNWLWNPNGMRSGPASPKPSRQVGPHPIAE